MSSTRWTGRIVLTVPPVKIFIASHQSCPILLNVGIPYAKTRERGLKTNPNQHRRRFINSQKKTTPHTHQTLTVTAWGYQSQNKNGEILSFLTKTVKKNVFRRIFFGYNGYKRYKKKFSICCGRTHQGYHMFKTASIFCNLFWLQPRYNLVTLQQKHIHPLSNRVTMGNQQHQPT